MIKITNSKILFALIIFVFLFSNNVFTAVRISKTDRDSDIPRVAINNSGDIMVIWHEHTLGPDKIYYTLKKYGEDWSNSKAIDSQGDGSNQSCDIYQMGDDFVVTWYNKKHDKVEFTKYTISDETWADRETINNVHEFSVVKICATEDRILVTWMEEFKRWDILGKIYTEGSGWSEVKNLSTGLGTSSKYQDLTVGPDGEFYAAWQQKIRVTGGSKKNPVLNIEDGKGKWSGPENINSDKKNFYRPTLAVNMYGTQLLVYYNSTNTRYLGHTFKDGDTHTKDSICNGDPTDHDQYMADAVSYGGGFIVIAKNRNKYIVYSIWDENDPQWTDTTKLGNGKKPGIDIHSTIGAVAVWQKAYTDNIEIFAEIFDIGSGVFSPINQKAELLLNEGIFRDAYFYFLTWEKNPKNSGITINKYNIYRRAGSEVFKKIADVDANTPEYSDYSLGETAKVYYYYVTALDSTGKESIIIQ